MRRGRREPVSCRSPARGAPATPSGDRQFLAPARRPPVRPRGRRPAARHRPSPTRPGASWTRRRPTPSSSATPSPATPTSPAARPRATRHPGWWDDLVGPGRPLDTDRYFVVCVNVLGGCQGTTGPSSADPADGPALRRRLPGRVDPRHGPHPGRGGRPPRHRPVAGGRRRLDGRHAGPRVGRDVPAAGALAGPHRHRRRRPRAWQIAFSRVGPPRHRSSTPKWRGGDYYDAEPGDGPHAGPRPGPDDRPDHLPQRRRCTRPGSAATALELLEEFLAVAALPGRALPRLPRREAGPPLRRQQLPAAQQGDGPARRRPRPGRRPRGPCAASRRRRST